MPRKNNIRWHAGNKAWVSAAGEVSARSGKRKPVYFRNIPYGPPGSPNHRAARLALERFLDARDAQVGAAGDETLGELARLYARWAKHRVGLGKVRPNTLRGHLQGLRRFLM